jgi:diguanylate cyclase (GGDEF)-like protein
MERELLLGLAAMAGAVLGILLGWVLRRSEDSKLEDEVERQRRNYRELSEEMSFLQEELSRKREIATKIPMIVRRLSGRLSPGSIPAMAVRFTKEFFHASQVGFFAPAEGEEQFTLIEGVGFPMDWKGKIRLAPDEGILGMSLQNMIVTTWDGYYTAKAKWPTGIHSLEKNGVSPDIVAPVTTDSKVLGVLVIASSTVRISNESAFASMIADLLGNAYKHATTIETVEQSASIDPLTKIFSRGHFAQRFETEIRRASNYGHPLSLLLLDIDHFKDINDTHGHPVGDLILMKMGQILRRSIRPSDFAARYGGEEFAVVMTIAGKEQAYILADSLRKIIESTLFPIPGQETPLQVTISGGVSSLPKDGASTTDILRAADEALYKAKQTGRNRIVRAQELGLDGVPVR